MAKDRPETTLFLLSSLDGRISTGDVDERDVDKDFPKIPGIKEGLHQYYELEKETDVWSLNTGKVMAKMGMNEKEGDIERIEILRFVIIDNKPHLKEKGVINLTKLLRKLYLVTTNKNHPAFGIKDNDRLEVIHYPGEIDFVDLFTKLKRFHGAERMTIQSGGTMNALLLRKGLIDHVSIVIAPALIGGKGVTTVVDGEPIRLEKDLADVRALKLKKCELLKDSYLHLFYDVINKRK